MRENLTLDWSVTQIGDLFTYKYDISGYQTPGISHFIISLSEGCSLDPNCITNASNFSYGVYNATDQGNSNNGFPPGISIDGVKFNFGSEGSTTYTFTSDRAACFTETFFLKGGNGPFAYDAGLANPGSDANAFIARPDTTGSIGTVSAVPEPGHVVFLRQWSAPACLGALLRSQAAEVGDHVVELGFREHLAVAFKA